MYEPRKESLPEAAGFLAGLYGHLLCPAVEFPPHGGDTGGVTVEEVGLNITP